MSLDLIFGRLNSEYVTKVSISTVIPHLGGVFVRRAEREVSASPRTLRGRIGYISNAKELSKISQSLPRPFPQNSRLQPSFESTTTTSPCFPPLSSLSQFWPSQRPLNGPGYP
jgi:hypothetical protein